jgi:hypothetical protein
VQNCIGGRAEGADNQGMDFHETATLGRTGLKVGRLGIASGYGTPPQAIEMAFERGCNCLTALDLGSLDEAEMARARRIGDHIYARPRIA